MGHPPTHTFQTSMDHFVPVQIAETAGDPDQLQTSEWIIRFPMC